MGLFGLHLPKKVDNTIGQLEHNLTHNPVTNFAGNAVVKPAVQFGVDAAHQAYNRGIAPAFGLPQENFNSPFNSTVNKLKNFSGATGSGWQTLGSGAVTAVNALAPGTSGTVEKGIAGLLPKAAPTFVRTVVPKVAAGAVIGAPVGGVSSVGAYLANSGGHPTFAGAKQAAEQGVVGGAALGGAFPAAGIAGRGLIRVGAKAGKNYANHLDTLNAQTPEAPQPTANVPAIRVKSQPATMPKSDVQKYVQQQIDAQKKAANPQSVNVRTNVDKFRQKFVDALAPIEDPIIAAKGRKGALPLRNQIDRSLRSRTVSEAFARENGLHDIIHSVKNTDEFNQYLIAKHAQDLTSNGVKTGRDLVKDRALIKELEPKYKEAAGKLQQYNHKVLDKAVGYGLITKEGSQYLKKKYPNYVPFERIFTDAEKDLQQGRGSGVASLSTQGVIRKIEGSTRKIAPPLESVINKTNEMVSQGERNLAARELIKHSDVLDIKPLRTADDVKVRFANYKKMAALRPVAAALKTESKRTVKQLRSVKVRNSQLGPSILKDVKASASDVRGKSIKLANNAKGLPSRSKRPAKLPNEADIHEAFQQYLDGNPKLVKNMYEFMGNKSQAAQLEKKLNGLKDQFDRVKQQRRDAFDEARLHADASSKGKATISHFKDGIKEIYQVSPEIAAAAKSLNQEQIGLIGHIMRYGTRVLRVGATGANVAFALANVAKDTLTGFINSEHSLRASAANPKVFLLALKAAANHGGKEYGEMLHEAATGTSFDIAREAAAKSVKQIRAERNAPAKALYTVTHPAELLRAVEDTIGRTEDFNRAIQYFGNKEAAKLEGKSDAYARMYGADAARNNTVNFYRAGEYGRVLNSALPYLNAGFQGSRTLLRTAKERPQELAGKLAIALFTPVAATTAWNLNDPERKKAYDDISEYEKQNNIIIVPPHPKQDAQGRWNVIKIPLSQEVANLGNIVRGGVQQMKDDKNIDFKEVAGNLLGTGTSLQAQSGSQVAGQLIPQTVKPAAEVALNRNFFTGQQIVPDAIKNLPAQDQYDKGTSGTARVVGAITRQSPLKIDDAIQTTLGGLGQNIVHTTDTGLAKAGVIKESDIRGKSFGTAIAQRFNSAQGKTDGARFFSTLQDTAKNQHLAGADYDQLNSIFAKSLTPDGKPKLLNEQDSLEKNRILAASPNISKVVAQTEIDLAKKTGKDVNPLYKLSPEQQQMYYQIHATPYKSDDYQRLVDKSQNWLPKLQDDMTAYFDKNPLPIGSATTDKVPYPKFSKSTSDLLDQASQLSGAERAKFIQDNPDLQSAYDQISQYTNDKRIAQGYDPFKAFPKLDANTQSAITAYNSLAKGTGARSAWIRAHPDTYAKMQDYYGQEAAWELANNAGKAKYEGTDLNQQALKAAFSLGQYDIKKSADGTYAFAPGAGSGSSGGSGGTKGYAKRVSSGHIAVRKGRGVKKGRSIKVAGITKSKHSGPTGMKIRVTKSKV